MRYNVVSIESSNCDIVKYQHNVWMALDPLGQTIAITESYTEAELKVRQWREDMENRSRA